MKRKTRIGWVAVLTLGAIVLCGCGKSAPEEPVKEPEPVVEPEEPAEPPPVWTKDGELQTAGFASLDEAMKQILDESDPLVIGFGEVHQLEGTVKIESAIERFTKWVVPQLKGRTSHLVIETWVNLGLCGEQEKQVHKDLDETTERPETTENEVVRLIRRAQQLGLGAHVIELTCKDYDSVLDDKGDVDYFAMLGLITRGLADKTKGLVSTPNADGSPGAVAIYGGAIHNDVAPLADLEPYSYAAALAEAAGGRYVEVDLLVPEFVETSEPFKAQPWYPTYARLASKEKVSLIKRGERSYIVVLRKGVAVASPDQSSSHQPSAP